MKDRTVYDIKEFLTHELIDLIQKRYYVRGDKLYYYNTDRREGNNATGFVVKAPTIGIDGHLFRTTQVRDIFINTVKSHAVRRRRKKTIGITQYFLWNGLPYSRETGHQVDLPDIKIRALERLYDRTITLNISKEQTAFAVPKSWADDVDGFSGIVMSCYEDRPEYYVFHMNFFDAFTKYIAGRYIKFKTKQVDL